MASDKFKSWVKQYGVKRLAGDLEVHPSSVYGWMAGTMKPSDPHRQHILRLAGRKLKLSDIVNGY